MTGRAQRGRPVGSSPRRWDDHLVPWLVAAAAALAYVALAWPAWRDVATPSWDLGIFTQLARAYSEGGPPVVDIKGHGFNLLGDHFHPLLVLLGPLYRLHPSGWTLLVTQAVLLALSAVPITSVARQMLGRAVGTVLGVGYAFSWGLQGAVLAQFHEIAFAVPLVAMSLAAFLRGRALATALWAAPLVLVKEDLGLTVAALGLVLVWRAAPPGHRSDHAPDDEPPARQAALSDSRPGAPAEPRTSSPPGLRERARSFVTRTTTALDTRDGRIGAVLTIWGVVWVVLAVVVILPLLNPGGEYDYVGRIGEEHSDWFATVVTILWPPVKVVTLVLLVLAAGIVGVRSPLAWLLLPTLAWRFVGNVEYYWGWEWHYSAILMPVVAAALIDVVRRPQWPDLARSVAVVASVASTLAVWPTLPLVTTFGDGPPEPSMRIDAAHAAVAAAGAVTPRHGDEPLVVGDIFLLAHLVPTTDVHWIGNEGNPVPDAVVLDTWRREPGDQDVEVVAEREFPGWDFEVVQDELGYAVAALVGPRD
ncbi:DUF2079 domain-containing protein [Georgenia sp. Z1344]|uniref:DUF2079 domain-containing protein n=1 Tax=Georgenia sp. Z1344 TaxID=3416706 RepID=UPI003CEA3B29